MNFWLLLYTPDDPMSTIMKLAVWCVVIVSARTNVQLAIALSLSLFTAVFFTEIDREHFHIFALVCCGFIACWTIEHDQFVWLNIESHEINYAFGVLCWIRAVIGGLEHWKIMPAEGAWIVSVLFLLSLQLVLVLGGCARGRRNRINRFCGDIRHLVTGILFDTRRHDH